MLAPTAEFLGCCATPQFLPADCPRLLPYPLSHSWFPLGKTCTDLGALRTQTPPARSAPGPAGAGVEERGWRAGWRVTGAAALPRLEETSPAGPGSFGGDLAQPATSGGDDPVDQREAPHLPRTVARLEHWVCARESPKQKQTPEEHASRGPPQAPQASRPSPPLWDPTAGVLSPLPSRERPPGCKAAAPARPRRAGIFNYFLSEIELGVCLRGVGEGVESDRAELGWGIWKKLKTPTRP